MKNLRKPQTPADWLYVLAAFSLAAVAVLNFFDVFGESHRVTSGVMIGLVLLSAFGVGRHRSGSR